MGPTLGENDDPLEVSEGSWLGEEDGTRDKAIVGPKDCVGPELGFPDGILLVEGRIDGEADGVTLGT